MRSNPWKSRCHYTEEIWLACKTSVVAAPKTFMKVMVFKSDSMIDQAPCYWWIQALEVSSSDGDWRSASAALKLLIRGVLASAIKALLTARLPTLIKLTFAHSKSTTASLLVQ